MKNITNILLIGLLMVGACPSFAQRKCGIEAVRAALIAKDPSWAQKFEQQKASRQGIADNYKLQMASRGAERTTATISPIPVIFHVIVSATQLAQMGGYSGIAQRCDSQIAVLNRDFNRQNPDSTGIPALWKPLYGNVGVHFGLAHTAPNGYGSYGYEVLISDYPFIGDYSDAKYATHGLPAWDNTKYMNVWCISFADAPSLLGITIPLAYTGGTGSPVATEGICINFLALGSQTIPATLTFPSGGNYTMGRTLTHEVGHFFEIWHTWGDDAGLCPWNGGSDDGIADTPPEGDAHYGFIVDTIPGGTVYDECQYNGTTNEEPIGVATLDYLNYTDDNSMHMFTVDQAASMAAMVLVPPGAGTGANGLGTAGESYSLTQNPNLLNWPADAAVAPVNAKNSLNIYPNPTTGIVNITFDAANDQLQQVSVTNILGQEVANTAINGLQKEVYSIDLSGMGKGIYFIRCNFASGSITRKILLQ